MLLSVVLMIIGFTAIWVGSGLILSAMDKFASSIKVSSFTISFFLLGILTSIPEISIGINATILKDPPIFVGNLLGGVVVIFLLVIPVLGIITNGIILNHELDKRHLLQILVTISAPMFLVLNNKVSIYEGLFCILLYAALIYNLSKKQSFIENIKSKFTNHDNNFANEIIFIGLGIIILIFGSNLVVKETLDIARLAHISEFILSLLALAVGTNLPELSVAIRSAFIGKNEIAFGNYLGSAAANTLIFGSLVIVNTSIQIPGNYIFLLITMILSLSLFFYFATSKNQLSRIESMVLLFLYFFYVLLGLNI